MEPLWRRSLLASGALGGVAAVLVAVALSILVADGAAAPADASRGPALILRAASPLLPAPAPAEEAEDPLAALISEPYRPEQIRLHTALHLAEQQQERLQAAPPPASQVSQPRRSSSSQATSYEPVASSGSTQVARIIIPKLGVDRGVVTMSLGSDRRTLQTPKNASDIVWWNFSGQPGSGRNATFGGHINYNGVQGAFRYLGSMSAGDRITIVMKDGRTLVYEVTTQWEVRKPALTWGDLGCTPSGCAQEDTITLITCGGAFDPSSGHYVNNVLLRARLVSS